MDLRQAKYFEAVCKTGSISAAAEELYISRSVISRNLHELEEEFNANLLVHDSFGIEPSPAGEILLEHCRQLHASYNVAKNKIDALSQDTPRDHIKMATTTTVGIRLFPEFFSELEKACPCLTYTIREMSANDTVESVRDGVVDLAFTPAQLDNENNWDIGSIFLHHVESAFGISRKNPLSREPFLTREHVENLPFATPINPNPLHFPVRVVLWSNQLELIHRAVAGGFTITLLPTDYMRDWDDVACIQYENLLISKVHMIWNKNVTHSDTFYRLLEFVKAYDITKLENL